MATRAAPSGADDARTRNVGALLDAAERLLIEVGHAAITTRRLAQEAGLNPGLVHYYFGSMDEVLVQVLERFTQRLIDRQRRMYARRVPFSEKWRTAMGYIEEDLASGYPKVWYELQALAWNRPGLSERVAAVRDEWQAVLTEACSAAIDEYGLDREAFPAEAGATLVATFNEGLLLDRLSGTDVGHRELLAWIDDWLGSLERGGGDGRGA